METFDQSVKQFDSYQDLVTAASEAVVTSYGTPVSGILYDQGGRSFISAGLPVKILLDIAVLDSIKKEKGKQPNPDEAHNRPLERSHVKEIREYLTGVDQYLLPPVMLNADRPIQVFALRTGAKTKPCVFVLPGGEQFYVTDGQHRLEALRQALREKQSLENDSVGVTIVQEPNLDKIHQDFFDAAQGKPLARALLVEYDGREQLNATTKDICASATIFKGRIERVGTVGKNSLMLFTNNQVKQGIIQLVVGDWSLFADALEQQTRQALDAAPELWRERIVAFFEEFTRENPEWSDVANHPLEAGQGVHIPSFRENCLHFSGAGLFILCGVGHTILALEGSQDGSLTSEQREYIKRLASLDWSRQAPLWRASVIDSESKISAAKNKVVLAVAQAKEAIGLSLTAKEVGIVQRAQEELQQVALAAV